MTTETLYKLIFGLIILIMAYYVVLELILIITDSFSLSLVKKYVLKKDSGLINKGHFKKIFAFSTISYLISIFLVYICFCVINGEFNLLTFILVIYRLVTTSVLEPQLTAIYTVSVLGGFCVNLLFNFFFVFKNLYATRGKRLISALTVSLITAPYFLFVSFEKILDCIEQII